MKIALIQMNSGGDMARNIADCEAMVAKAASQGAELIATPENSFYMEVPGEKPAHYTQAEHPGVMAAQGWAKRHKVWILIGSVAITAGAKSYNRSILINPLGEVVECYDKIHLFDVDVPGDRSYKESDRILAGGRAVHVQGVGEGAVLGLTICYDVRFPQLYRALAKEGANIITVPAAFTAVTGEAHWHVLLRARAIENGCFVIAPAQTGTHPGNRKTFGHSLVINPWGKIIVDGGTEPGVILAEIDLGEVARVRGRLPSLEHDRDFS